MSQLNKVNLIDKYNNPATGLYKAGQSRGIGSEDHREKIIDLGDSLFNLIDHKFSGAAGLKPGITTITDLKAITTTNQETGIFITFRDTGNNNVLRVYELVSGADAEASPSTLRPADYAATTNEKVWKLASLSDGGNLWNDRGGHNASGGTFPSTNGSGLSGAIMRYNAYLVTTPGMIGDIYVPEGAILLALQNSPTGDFSITGWKMI